MAVDKAHITENGLYFITFTNFEWLPLFDIANAYEAVYKWLDHLKSKGHKVTGYVIMPNHVHVLILFNADTKSINTIVSNGKRFMAYYIVEQLERSNRKDILSRLSAGVSSSDRKRGKKHQVFEPSFDMKLCYSRDFIEQKLDYIHQNPVSKKWNLAKDAMSYKYSSAGFYCDGSSIYEVDNVWALWTG